LVQSTFGTRNSWYRNQPALRRPPDLHLPDHRTGAGWSNDRNARIAISGHGCLSRAIAALIGTAIRAAVAEQAPHITGISCLANGADQIFARAAADADGKLEAIIPGARYRDGCTSRSGPG